MTKARRRKSRFVQLQLQTLEERALLSDIPFSAISHRALRHLLVDHAPQSEVSLVGQEHSAPRQLHRVPSVKTAGHSPRQLSIKASDGAHAVTVTLKRSKAHKKTTAPTLPPGVSPAANLPNFGSGTTSVEFEFKGKEHIVVASDGNDPIIRGVAQPSLTTSAVSVNGGQSFKETMHLPMGNPYVGNWGDPALAYSYTTHEVYLSSLPGLDPVSNELLVYRSLNGGETYLPPVDASPGLPASDEVDRDAIAVDNWPNVPGSNVSGNGIIYAAYRVFSPDVSLDGIYLSRSFDGGATWDTPQMVVQDPWSQCASVVVGSFHDVYIFYYESWPGLGGVIDDVVSHDNGNTFSIPQNIQFSTNPNLQGSVNVIGNIRSLDFPQIAVNPVTSDFYMTWCDYSSIPGQGPSIYLATMNHDMGVWSTPQIVSVLGTEDIQWDAQIAVSPDGTHIGISWYRQNIQTAGITRWSATGTVNNLGVLSLSAPTITMNPPEELTPQPFYTQYDAYLGDLSSVAADPNGFLAAFTWVPPNQKNAVDVIRFRAPN